MNTPSGTWRDIRLHLWQGEHDLAPDQPTVCCCFERRGASGYVYTVVTPEGKKVMSMNAFYAYVKGHRKELDITSDLKMRLFEAWQDGYADLRRELNQIQDTTAVGAEVMRHA